MWSCERKWTIEQQFAFPRLKRRRFLTRTAPLFLILFVALPAHGQMLGPLPYLSFDYSPFKGPTFQYFHLEDFEDGPLDTPGVSAAGRSVMLASQHISTTRIYIDSVDADNGLIDGSGNDGDSLWAEGRPGFTFTFDAVPLGSLPTHVGIVWTDGGNSISFGNPIIFEAFDKNGLRIGRITGNHSDSDFGGRTAEDRFYGVINETGISRITISNNGGGIEVDHLQYGRAAKADIKIVSATTDESMSVTFTYETAGTPPPFQIAVCRSSDDQFDVASDVALSSAIITSPAPGQYTGTIPIPGGLGIDPAHPFVLIVADPTRLIDETIEDNNVAFFRKYTIGVVTHGYDKECTFDPRITGMCQEFSSFGYTVTIPFDWSATSCRRVRLQAVFAGHSLASRIRLAAASIGASSLDAVDLHLIGHSRGAVVISQAMQDLITSGGMTDQLRRGYFKMTMLDPHPASNRQSLYSHDPDSNLSWLLVGSLITFQDIADDPDPFFPSDVQESEVFYQQTEWYDAPPIWERFLNLWGLATIASDKSVSLTRPLIGHSEVLDWYAAHIPAVLLNPSLSPQVLDASSAVFELDAASLGLGQATSGSAEKTDITSDIDLLVPTFINNRGVGQSVLTKLAESRAAFALGNIAGGKAVLGAFRDEVQAQQGKHIRADVALVLLSAAEIILDSTGLLGDLNADGSVDRIDLNILMAQIRVRSTDLTYDLNGDRKVDVADSRWLVLHFTKPGGNPQ